MGWACIKRLIGAMGMLTKSPWRSEQGSEYPNNVGLAPQYYHLHGFLFLKPEQ